MPGKPQWPKPSESTFTSPVKAQLLERANTVSERTDGGVMVPVTVGEIAIPSSVGVGCWVKAITGGGGTLELTMKEFEITSITAGSESCRRKVQVAGSDWEDTVTPGNAHALATSGTCSVPASWQLPASTDMVTVSGGAMGVTLNEFDTMKATAGSVVSVTLRVQFWGALAAETVTPGKDHAPVEAFDITVWVPPSVQLPALTAMVSECAAAGVSVPATAGVIAIVVKVLDGCSVQARTGFGGGESPVVSFRMKVSMRVPQEKPPGPPSRPSQGLEKATHLPSFDTTANACPS